MTWNCQSSSSISPYCLSCCRDISKFLLKILDHPLPITVSNGGWWNVSHMIMRKILLFKALSLHRKRLLIPCFEICWFADFIVLFWVFNSYCCIMSNSLYWSWYLIIVRVRNMNFSVITLVAIKQCVWSVTHSLEWNVCYVYWKEDFLFQTTLLICLPTLLYFFFYIIGIYLIAENIGPQIVKSRVEAVFESLS